ncbi:winged helix-turn-helix domain-containing tetratricopeptide repeat protein [Aquisalimonas sp.]|uniref:winged helix-turn-helix domain-containing tetratricopeptide repeat protein n=1 Tax=Aquisalimonas sp. TaxID=1872621 RepID=UPI0025C020AE|nr:winged helix-turn-helix domain-containing tetratricopeptide repeat protein [Aquisalimonas sp.]
MQGITYRFEGFVFDPDAGTLLNSGQPVALEPQVLRLLQYLVENRGRIVSKDELIDEIWQGRLVSDAALNTRIRAVRRALGDDHVQQKFLRTYPKRGFQFVAKTDCLKAGGEGDASVRAFHAMTLHRAWVWAGPVILLLVLGVVGAVWWLNESEVAETSLSAKPSIVVLPFDNLSGDPDQEYFADAFTEDLITDLSRIRGAFVIARRTSFSFKEEAVDVKDVAADLGVRYVLEGSVRRSGDQVRINAQLIDGQTRSHVWSDRYDRDLTDVFSVQNNVTGQIAAALKAELREADSQRQRPMAGLKVWDYALRGNVLLFNPDSAEDFRDAKALLDKAVELDPSIASAWSGLAFVHFAASMRPIPGVSVANSKDLSLEAAQRAVSLDPKDAEGHWMVGVGYARSGQPERGLVSCYTAMELNPNNDCAYVCAGLANMALGNPTEALPHFRQSLRLNPRFRPSTKYTYMGLAHLHNGQDLEAITALNRAIAGSPNEPTANFALASALALTGREEEARAALEKSMALAYSDRTTVETLRASHSWMGPGSERVLEGLRLAGMREQ